MLGQGTEAKHENEKKSSKRAHKQLSRVFSSKQPPSPTLNFREVWGRGMALDVSGGLGEDSNIANTRPTSTR